jgi:acetylornithine deacetylase
VDPLIADVLELVEIPSVGGTPEEHDAQDWVARRLRAWGWEVEVWDDAPAAFAGHPDFPGMEVPRSRVTGVIGRPPGSTGTRLILGHTDVVPGGPAAGIAGSRLVGRGSVDMKAGLVAGLHAARSAGADAAICAVSGEEDGGVGAFLALQHGLSARECVIPEPTGLAIVAANAGSLTFRITLPGVAAHGARRWEGRSALDAAPEVLARLRALEDRRNADVPEILSRWPIAYPISIGCVRGGDWPSTVMAEVSLEGRYGVRLGEDLDDAIAAFEQALTGTAAIVDWFGGRFAPAALDTGHRLVRELGAAHRAQTGAAPVITGVTYGSDLRQLLAAGVPTVLYGPGDAAVAHSDHESVAIDEVQRCRAVLRDWLTRPLDMAASSDPGRG